MATSSAFRLPRDGAIYCQSIFSRCLDLIAYGLWSGIEPHQLQRWISNFKTEEERYFAARVLDSLIYRSGQQTIALSKQLFQRVIPDLARRVGLDGSLNRVYRALRNKDIDPGVRIVPVIPPKGAPVKSGPTVARMLRRHLQFQERWILRPEDVQSAMAHGHRFILVDDFLGTGIQLSEFLANSNLHTLLPSGSFIYAPLAGHAKGVEYLRTNFPTLHVGPVELLDDSHAVFHEASGIFRDGTNSGDSAREFYYALIADRKFEIDASQRRGFGHFELVYAFEHAVPDNSLPVLWWSHSANWVPLFPR